MNVNVELAGGPTLPSPCYCDKVRSSDGILVPDPNKLFELPTIMGLVERI